MQSEWPLKRDRNRKLKVVLARQKDRTQMGIHKKTGQIEELFDLAGNRFSKAKN